MKESGTSRGQIAILVALVAIFLLIIAFAPMLKSTPLTATDKRLRAKAGTERENVRALVSETASSTPDEQTGGPRDEVIDAWAAPKNSDRLKERQEAEDPDGLSEVVNSGDPVQGIVLLQSQLAAAQEVGAIVRIYTALARLYAFRDPPDAAAAALAFDHAGVVAPTAEVRHEIALDRMSALHLDAAPEEVLALVDTAVEPEDEASLAAMELLILKAAALEKLARRDEAITVYRDIMDQALILRERNALRAEDIYRQAAMRLARSYRELGRDKDADAVVRDVRRLAESAP